MRFFSLLVLCSALFVGASAAHLAAHATVATSAGAGATAVSALWPLPDGSRLLCLGTRWAQLDAAGTVRRSVPVAVSCQGLSLSPSGRRVMNVTGNGFTVWNVADGSPVADVPVNFAVPLAAADTLGRAALLSDDSALVATSRGLEILNFAAAQITHQTVYNGKVTSLFVSPLAQRAVISSGQKVQLLSLPDFMVLSGFPCGGDCTVKNVNFSADGQMAAALVSQKLAGQDLVGLRENLPATTILRRVSAAFGLPQPDNTVLTVTTAGVESRDFQTGRREKVVLAGGMLPSFAVQSGARILLLSHKGELLDADLAFKDIKRLPLPVSLPTVAGWAAH